MTTRDYIDKIDDYFATKNSNEVFIIFFGTFAIIAFIIYMLFFDPSELSRNEAQTTYNELKSNILKADATLANLAPNGDENFKINEELTRLNAFKTNLDDVRSTNIYFDKKLTEISYLLFNEHNWANFLDGLSTLARDNGIKIVSIANEFKNPTLQKIEQVLNISINLEGSFENILAYINAIEESKLIVDISKIDLGPLQNGNLTGKIEISLWGMKYL